MTIKLKIDKGLLTDDITIFGLVTDLPSHRLCYFVNENTGLRLVRSSRDKIHLYKRSQTVCYDQYEGYDTLQGLQWFLTANKNPVQREGSGTTQRISGLPLIPELKMIDFFLWFEGDAGKNFIQSHYEKLNTMPHIRTSKLVDADSVRNIDNLLLH